MSRTQLRKGDPGYGDKCPECEGPKSRVALHCQPCENARRAGQPGVTAGFYSEDAVWTISRRESIITFGRGDEVRTLHCFGKNTEGQTRNGRARLPEGDEWTVLCRSTPQSILADLRSSTFTDKGRANRRRYYLRTGQG